MISFKVTGNTQRTESFLEKIIHGDPFSRLEEFARRGVEALRAATPKDSGETAASWSYEIERSGNGATVWWTNSHVVNGFNVAIGLQYGHGTGWGGFVPGRDFINPALKPIFDEMTDAVWKEVQKA